MNVLLLCGSELDEFQLGVLTHLRDSSHVLCGCLIDDRPRPPLSERLRSNLRRGRGGYVAVMAVKLLSGTRRTSEAAQDVMSSMGVPTIVSDEPYAQDVLDRVRRLQADVGVLLGGFGILREPLISLPDSGVLSYHHGDMRRYRGQPPAFWELYNGEHEVVATVQRLDAGLDSGDPVVERRFPISEADTLRSVSSVLFGNSVDMMALALDRVASAEPLPPKIDRYGHVYTLPNLRQWLTYNARIAARRMRWYRSRPGLHRG